MRTVNMEINPKHKTAVIFFQQPATSFTDEFTFSSMKSLREYIKSYYKCYGIKSHKILKIIYNC